MCRWFYLAAKGIRKQGGSIVAETTLAWQGQCIRVVCPDAIAGDIAKLFGKIVVGSGEPVRSVVVSTDGERYVVGDGFGKPVEGLTKGDLATFVMDAVVRALIFDQKQGIVLHAGGVARDGKAVLVCGPSGSGKSSLICWLVDRGFDYLTDEIVLLGRDQPVASGLPRSLVVKPGSAEHILRMPAFRGASTVVGGLHQMIEPPASASASRPLPVSLVVFPEFAKGEEFAIAGHSAAECGIRLVQCNLNARNFDDGGFAAIARLARQAPAMSIRYGDYDQLPSRLDVLIDLALNGTMEPQRLRRFLTGFSIEKPQAPVPTSTRQPGEIRAPTPLRSERKSLTIGMATYDDFDGVYFTLQALRMYHGEALQDVEFLVIDNHPTGPCANELKKLEGATPDYRYIPASETTGTMVRQLVADEGRGDFILVMDCHVLLRQGALRQLRSYLASNSSTRDLLQGPMVHDNLEKMASHFRPEWQDGMFGVWDLDPRAEDPGGAPFEIPMQGLGLYAFRREAWPGFNPAFRGFGGEEWYIHEKFRRNGGRTLCLPFLRWLHRFPRPMGLPYVNRWEDRIRNYIIGFRELGQPTQPIEEHFTKVLGKPLAVPLIEAIYRDLERLRQPVGARSCL